MRKRFAHLPYVYRGSAVSVMELPAHLSQMHQGPDVGAAKLLAPISHMHQGPGCGCHGTTPTALSHALELGSGYCRTTLTGLLHSLWLRCACHGTTQTGLSHASVPDFKFLFHYSIIEYSIDSNHFSELTKEDLWTFEWKFLYVKTKFILDFNQ